MKIRYITSRSRAVRVEFEYTEGDALTLVFDPRHTGAVVLGGRILPLVGGEVRIPLSILADGDYTPRLETEQGIYLAEGFTKHGKSISVPDGDEDLVRHLASECYGLTNELDALKKRVGELERAYVGHKIFDFERKEHEKQN